MKPDYFNSIYSEVNRVRLRSLSGMRKHFSCDGQQSIIYKMHFRRERISSAIVDALDAVYRKMASR